MPLTFHPALVAPLLLAAATALAQPAPPDAAASQPAAETPEPAMSMGMAMHSAFGPYPMSREGSGTGWQPEATPGEGLHEMPGDWMVMAHGLVNVIADRQTGPRGDRKNFAESMFMLMGQRDLGPGTLGLRTMLSLDPAMGASGYPLLLQAGETADGRTPLVDRQHPHDALMEVAGSYSLPFGDQGAGFVYVGLPGEPALGPTTFMHRFSGMRNPEAPLTHHWLDSTHVSFGVVTLGASDGAWKLEGSRFNGREPDQSRWNLETGRLDSWSTRLSFNPTPAWALQVSYGELKQPEQLEPDTDVHRTTASASYQASVGGNPWQTTLAWGRNDKRGPDGRTVLPGWLLESTAVLGERHTLFGRWEQIDTDELAPQASALHGQVFRVRKLSIGYIFDIARTGPMRWGVGALIGFPQVPAALRASYGDAPRSEMVFLQGRL
jgi:hypothetical protein